jgi:hypothetical protein
MIETFRKKLIETNPRDIVDVYKNMFPWSCLTDDIYNIIGYLRMSTPHRGDYIDSIITIEHESIYIITPKAGKYSMSICEDWISLLSLPIKCEYSCDVNTLAHCLYEMTYYGPTNDYQHYMGRPIDVRYLCFSQ